MSCGGDSVDRAADVKPAAAAACAWQTETMNTRIRKAASLGFFMVWQEQLLGFDVKTLAQLELLALGQAGSRGVKAGNPALAMEVRVGAGEYFFVPPCYRDRGTTWRLQSHHRSHSRLQLR